MTSLEISIISYVISSRVSYYYGPSKPPRVEWTGRNRPIRKGATGCLYPRTSLIPRNRYFFCWCSSTKGLCPSTRRSRSLWSTTRSFPSSVVRSSKYTCYVIGSRVTVTNTWTGSPSTPWPLECFCSYLGGRDSGKYFHISSIRPGTSSSHQSLTRDPENQCSGTGFTQTHFTLTSYTIGICCHITHSSFFCGLGR